MALAAVLGAQPVQPPVGRLPETKAEIVAKMAGRPVQLTSYCCVKAGSRYDLLRRWVWSPAKRTFVKTYAGPVTVSPDERWQVTHASFRADLPPKMRLLDRKTGNSTDVELPVSVDPESTSLYLNAAWPTWSPDSKHLLLNVFKPWRRGYADRSEGVVLIDVPSLQPKFVRVENALLSNSGFQWTRDGKGIVAQWGTSGKSVIRQFDLQGMIKRTWGVPGYPVDDALGTFAPSGRRFVTACGSSMRVACVWDTATGKPVAKIKLADPRPEHVLGRDYVLGWYDEQHLLAPVSQGYGIVNLKGTVVETLIKVDKKDPFFYPWFAARDTS
ncbi:hypothetical protein [Nonomuraea sp. NPDC002799]